MIQKKPNAALLHSRPGERETSARPAAQEVPMCRHTPPAPRPQIGCDCSRSDAALLAVLERQTRLLTEILAAVNGLSAACLCKKQ